MKDALEQLQEYVHFTEVRQLVQQLLRHGAESRRLAVLSQERLEGKTFVSLAFALALSELHRKRVLLIHTNGYPQAKSLQVERVLESEEQPGQGPIRTMVLGIDTLEMSQADVRALDEVCRQHGGSYDWIILDTCALSQANRRNLDPWEVAERSDGALLVLTEATSRSDRAKRLKEGLRARGVSLWGTLWNRIPSI